MVEGRQRYTRTFYIKLYADVRLVGVLPAQVRVVNGLRRATVPGADSGVVSRRLRTEDLCVIIGWGGVQYLERRQFDAFAPSGMDAQFAYPTLAPVLPEDIASIETRRQRVDSAIVRTFDHGDVVAQTCRQL